MKLIRSLTPEIRIIDATRGICDYVASDESLDCYREIIKANGWKFDNFQKNAPFVDSHNYDSIDCLLGKVIDYRIDGKQLVERVQWAIDVPTQPLARLGWQLTVAGYLKAVSVGFFPTSMASKWGDEKQFMDAIKELGLSAEQAAQVRCIYLVQQQIELSACIIGANPNALAKAHQDGLVKDGDLAALGWDDEEFELLSHCANEDSSPLLRKMIAVELTRSLKISGRTPTPAPSAAKRADAEEACRRDQEFLRNFTALTH